MRVSDSYSYHVSFLLEAIDVFVCYFLIDLINNPNHVDNFNLIILAEINLIERLMIEMEPVLWKHRNIRLLRYFFYHILLVLKFKMVNEPSSI